MSDLQSLYQQIILDHAKYRHGASPVPLTPDDELWETDDTHIGESHQINTSCGDDVTVRLSITIDEAGYDAVGLDPIGLELGVISPDEMIAALRANMTVSSLTWHGDGCSISMASASVMFDTLNGLPYTEAVAVLENFREMLRSRGTIEPDEEVLGDAAAFGGVSRYPARVKCAMLPWVAFEAALADAQK